MHRTIFCIMLTMSIGCGPTTSEEPATDASGGGDAHAGHAHGDVGPHGGHLLHLEPSGAHAEWTHDDETKLVTVFLDDFESDSIQGAKFVVAISSGETEEFPLAAGSDGWTITGESLMTHMNMGEESAQVRLVVETADGEQSSKIKPHEHHHH